MYGSLFNARRVGATGDTTGEFEVESMRDGIVSAGGVSNLYPYRKYRVKRFISSACPYYVRQVTTADINSA